MTDIPSPQTRVIGRYSILRELRRGRYSASYAAVDPVMNRQLVLKAVELLPAGPKLTGAERRRVEQAFVRQAQAAGRLQHPHIVTVFDAGLSHAFGFLVIERVNGRPLHELLAGGLRPEFVQCASIGARIADAIECAHSNGVAHGHLGPQHVFLQPDGSPKVSGFGGWIDDGASGDEALAGTERLLPYFQNEVTEETRLRDVQAIGQILFMMLTGRAPPDPLPAASAELGGFTRAARRDTPAMLARLVDLALLAGRSGGPSSAGALRDALTAFIWNERSENVAPNTLGIPLAAAPPRPPARAPVHVATITPDDNAPPFRDDGVPASVPDTLPRPAVTLVSIAPQAPDLAGAAPAAAYADDETVPGLRPAPGTRAAPLALAPAAAPSAAARPVPSVLEPEAWIERIRPWAVQYRIALFGVGAFFALAIFLGVVLGNLRHVPASALASDTAGGAAVTGAPPVTAAPVRVDLQIRPWGEVFVDGKPTGVTPPMDKIELEQGRHHIEIHHEPSPAWSFDLDVHGNDPIRFEHDFP